jgi:hypothetical protein
MRGRFSAVISKEVMVGLGMIQWRLSTACLLAMGTMLLAVPATASGLEFRLEGAGSSKSDSWVRGWEDEIWRRVERTRGQTRATTTTVGLRVVVQGGEMKESITEEELTTATASNLDSSRGDMKTATTTATRTGGYRLWKADGRTFEVDPEHKTYAEAPRPLPGFRSGATFGTGLAKIKYRFSKIAVRLESLPDETISERHCLHQRIVVSFVEETRPATWLMAGSWSKSPTHLEADYWIDPGVERGVDNAAALLRFRGTPRTTSAEANALIEATVMEIAKKGLPVKFSESVLSGESGRSTGASLTADISWTASGVHAVELPVGEFELPAGYSRTESGQPVGFSQSEP